MAATSRPCVLQINQTGAWRTALDFDATDMPDEFLAALDQAFRLADRGRMSARVVMAKPSDNGRPLATAFAIKRWSAQEGWVNV